MANFDFKKSSRKCYESERAFQPGENFFSVLIELDNGETERRDFGSDAWDGPPENSIGWWKCLVPEVGKGKVYWAPRQVLLAYFNHVRAHESTTDIAYVTALLLSQKRILKLIDNRGNESLVRLKDPRSNETYEVPVVDILPLRLTEIQDELSEKLFMDQPADFESEMETENEQ